MTDGHNTMLAREFDGIELSGGEWQRVAIAEIYIENEKNHAVHWMYICGYNDGNDTFYCCDNFSGSKFRLEEITIEEIRDGYLGSYRNAKNAFILSVLRICTVKDGK